MTDQAIADQIEMLRALALGAPSHTSFWTDAAILTWQDALEARGARRAQLCCSATLATNTANAVASTEE